jgi:PrgI family protein
LSKQRIRLPADVEIEDRLAFGLTARQLVILVVTALVCYAVFAGAGSVLPLPVAVVLAGPLALVGVALALGRLDGLSGDRLALAATRHLSQPPRRIVAPEGTTAPLPAAPMQPRVSLLGVPVRAVLRSGVVELADGTSALVLAASGTSWELRSEEEQAALCEAYGRFLNSLVEDAAIVVRSEAVDLAQRASAIEADAPRLPHPALRHCARTYAEFLTQLAGEGLRRRQILLVLSTRNRERDATRTALERRANEATALLRAASVELRALDGEQVAPLLLAALEPPGPPLGSYLDGEVRGCS